MYFFHLSIFSSMIKRYWLVMALSLLYFSVESALFYSTSFINLFINQSDFVTGVTKLMIYLLVSFTASSAVIFGIFSKSPLVRLVTYVLTLFVFADYFSYITWQEYINVDIVVLTINEFLRVFDIIDLYIIKILVLASIYFILVVVKERYLSSLNTVHSSLSISLLIVAFTLGCYLLIETTGRRNAFTAAVRVPAIFVYLTRAGDFHGLFLPYQKRVLEDNVRPKEQMHEKIVFFVDESISGNFLFKEYNGKSTTPYLADEEWNFVNLGCANSVSNISNQTGYILRNGLTINHLPDSNRQSFTMPSIFTFAKRAGYTTVMMDRQLTSETILQNFLSFHDLADIDHYIVASRYTPVFERDHSAIPILKELLERHDRIFIWVNKEGAHAAYNRRYPQDKAVFLPDSYYGEGKELLLSNKSKQSPVLNSYLNVIRWNVDTFLREFIDSIDISSVSVIYTSDHGQSILGESTVTHGQKIAPPMIQASVPLLIFGEEIMARFESDISRNHYSQFQVFPTLLSMMGYGGKVVGEYGKPLWDGPDMDSRRFVSGSIFSENFFLNPISIDCDIELHE